MCDMSVNSKIDGLGRDAALVFEVSHPVRVVDVEMEGNFPPERTNVREKSIKNEDLRSWVVEIVDGIINSAIERAVGESLAIKALNIKVDKVCEDVRHASAKANRAYRRCCGSI